MERLTYWKENGHAGFRSDGTPMENALQILTMLDRLAAYEDTGLEPEEIDRLVAMHQRDRFGRNLLATELEEAAATIEALAAKLDAKE